MQETWVWSLIWEDPWRREWQTSPVSLPENCYGQRSAVVKNLPDGAGDTKDFSSIPGSGRSFKVGNGNLLHYSCLGNPIEEPSRLQSLGVAKCQTWLRVQHACTKRAGERNQVLMFSASSQGTMFCTQGWETPVFPGAQSRTLAGGTADRSLRIRHEYKKKMTSLLDYCFPRLVTQFTYSYNLKQALHHLSLWPRTSCMPTSAKMMGLHLLGENAHGPQT